MSRKNRSSPPMRVTQEMWDQITEIVSDQLGVDSSRVTSSSTIDDLNGDSLDKVDVAMDLEDKFGIEFPDGRLSACESLGDLARLVTDLLTEKKSEKATS